MQPKEHARWLVPALAVLAGFSLPTGEVRFHPEEKSELTKTFEIEIELAITETSWSMGGREMEVEVEGGVHLSRRVTVTDVYAEVGGGRPLRLLRTFDRLTGGAGVDEAEFDPEELESELEGHSVAFTWDEEASSSSRSCATSPTG